MIPLLAQWGLDRDVNPIGQCALRSHLARTLVAKDGV